MEKSEYRGIFRRKGQSRVRRGGWHRVGGEAHPETGLNGAQAGQAKGDGLEDRP